MEIYMLNNNAKFSDYFELYQFDLDEDGEISNLTKKELDGNQIKSNPCE